MKLTILQKALEYYLRSAECSDDEAKQAFDAIRSLAATADRFQSKDANEDEVYVITTWTLDNMLNNLTYDIYGKRKRIHGDEMIFMYYAADCRKEFELEELTDEQLMLGYEIIADLWRDNETEGNNNPDGTYNKEQ